MRRRIFRWSISDVHGVTQVYSTLMAYGLDAFLNPDRDGRMAAQTASDMTKSMCSSRRNAEPEPGGQATLVLKMALKGR